VGSPEEDSSANSRDFAAGIFFKRHVLLGIIGVSKSIGVRKRNESIGPGSDGVYLDSDGRSRFSSGERRYVSCIVIAVCQQYDDSALRSLVFQTIGSGDQGGSNGGAVLHKTWPERGLVPNPANGKAREVLNEPFVVKSERADQVGPPGKRDDSNPVI